MRTVTKKVKPSKAERERNARELAIKERSYRRAAAGVNRLLVGIENPERYQKYAEAFAVLRIMPTIIDNFLTDFESFGEEVGFEEEKTLRKMMRETRNGIERLLKYSYEKQVEDFSREDGDRETGKRITLEVSDVACEFSRLLTFMFRYCQCGEDKWRMEEIYKTLDRIITDDVVKDKAERVRAYCQEYLKEYHITRVEQGRAVIAGLNACADKIRQARKEGKTVRISETITDAVKNGADMCNENINNLK